MGSLRDQLLKAKLIDKKKARQAEHEAKRKKKELGKKGIDKETSRKKEAFDARERERREQDREREKKRKLEKEAQTGIHRLRDICQKGIIREKGRATRQFHFVTRDGRISYTMVSDEMDRRLEAGSVAIVENPGTEPLEYVVVTNDTAEKISALDPESVRFLNR